LGKKAASWGLAILVFLQLLDLMRWIWNRTVPLNPTTSVLSLAAIVVLAVASVAFAFWLVGYLGRND